MEEKQYELLSKCRMQMWELKNNIELLIELSGDTSFDDIRYLKRAQEKLSGAQDEIEAFLKEVLKKAG